MNFVFSLRVYIHLSYDLFYGKRTEKNGDYDYP